MRTNIRYHLLGIAAAALCITATTVQAHSPLLERPWVLLSLYTGMGTVVAVGTDGPASSGRPAELASFETSTQCRAALSGMIRRYSGLTHAEGNLNSYLCSDLRSWQQGE
jgi:hypothetical protein